MAINPIREGSNPKMTISNILNLAGCRYWTASILPALIGTTLPFWLDPPGFSFKWLESIEFILATVLCHAGFFFLLTGFEYKSTELWTKSKILSTGFICLFVVSVIGLHLNSNLQLNRNVNPNIFLFYG